MRRVHLIGRRNHGKTTLMVALARELTERGLTVGTIKHSGHDHQLDRPGKDSFRHREAGGSPAAVITPTTTAVYLDRDVAAPYATLEPLYQGCDLVLVEGDADARAPKVEVWRAAPGSEPMALTRPEVAAVITDDPAELPCPRWPRREIPRIADNLLALLDQGREGLG